MAFLGGCAGAMRRSVVLLPRRALSSPPSGRLSEADLFLYSRLTELEADGARKLAALEAVINKLEGQQKTALELLRKSTSEGQKAVQETAAHSVMFVAGWVSLGLGGLYIMSPGKAKAEARDAQAKVKEAKGELSITNAELNAAKEELKAIKKELKATSIQEELKAIKKKEEAAKEAGAK